MDTVDAVAAHRPYGLDCKCGRPINSDADWAQHLIDALGLTEETRGMVACECGHPRIDHRPADLGPFQCYGRQGKCDCKTWNRRLQSRLVSGWVRKDNTNE